MRNRRGNMEDSRSLKKKGFISFSAAGITLILLAVVLVVEEAIYIFADIRFLKEYFYLGWIIYGTIIGGIYARKATGGETYLSTLNLSIVCFVVIWISYYVGDLIAIRSEYGSAAGFYNFFEYVKISWYDMPSEVSFFSGQNSPIVLEGWWNVGFQLLALVVISVIAHAAISKKNKQRGIE